MSTLKLDDRLVSYLCELSIKESPEIESIKSRHRDYFNSVRPLDLALAEQELVNRGVEFDDPERRLQQHIKLLNSRAKKLLKTLPPDHILVKLIREHRRVGYVLHMIKQVCDRLQQIAWLTPTHPEFEKLLHIADDFETSAKHSDIEENVLFPAVEKIGIDVILNLLRLSHVEIRYYSERLHAMAYCCCMKNPAEISERFAAIEKRLCPLKKSHMLMEENLIYPIALDVVSKRIWLALQKECEAVGFCEV